MISRNGKQSMVALRYKAFISYSHEDEAFAAWLHDRLERYRVPLRIQPNERRLGVFFRDREELAGGHMLSTAIVEALETSEYLIVICSPAAATSTWVAREIEAFLACGRKENTLLIVPDSSPRGAIDFPVALDKLDEELLAADARVPGDGKQGALLKLVAGLLKVRFDELVQRERRRQRQRLLLIGTGATTIVVAILVSLLLVQGAEREAEERRQQAESFVGFLVDDIEERIEEYERVGEIDEDLAKALEFFSTTDLEQLNITTLQHYRTALLGVGSVRIRQGKPKLALDAFNRAAELGRSIVDRDATKPDWWYDLAVGTYYIGEAHWEMQDIQAAAEHMVESLKHAERAAGLAPDEFKYQIEVVYGLNNLGAVHTRLKNYVQVVQFLVRALEKIDALRESHADREQDLVEQEVEAVSWMVEVTQAQSRYSETFAWHTREIELRRQLIEATGNAHHQGRLSDALGFYANSLTAIGDSQQAIEVLREALDASLAVTTADPDNATWRSRLLIGHAMLANALFEAGDSEEAYSELDRAESGMDDMIDKDQQANAARLDCAYVDATRAYMLVKEDPGRAVEFANLAASRLRSEVDKAQVNPIALSNYFRSIAVLAAAQRGLDQYEPNHLDEALHLLTEHGSQESSTDLAYRVIFLSALGKHTDAQAFVGRLASVGYQPVFYQTMLKIFEPSSP